MKRRFKKSIFIFRRDLRVNDNTGLMNALESSDCVYPIFILDKSLLTSSQAYSSFRLPIQIKSLYKSRQKRCHLLHFLKESLVDLQKQFNQLDKLNNRPPQESSKDKELKTATSSTNHHDSRPVLFYGDPCLLISKIIKLNKNIEAVFVNRDYTPYSMKRDSKISNICKSNSVDFIQCTDILLNEPEQIQNSENKPFRVFFQYYKKAIERPVREVSNHKISRYKDVLLPLDSEGILADADIDEEQKVENVDRFFDSIISNQSISNNVVAFVGGREGFEKVVSNLGDRLNNYKEEKDVIIKEATSHLSAYVRFGICSIREAFFIIQNELGDNNPLLRQLYWRDFFTYIGFHYPHVFTESFQEKYRNANNPIQWRNDPKQFEMWCNGKTGFPIVDAGMRELNTTGYMHNRIRLVTASFFVKDLHIDWRYGERYFALKLVDYDPSVNNGNWQWVASTGCDALPYFRTFNPWLQQKKIDPECIFVKKWIPELKPVPAKLIHKWYKINESDQYNFNHFQNSKEYNFEDTSRYPKPIVNHQTEMLVARQLYEINM